MESTAAARHEIEATRERMSGTIAEIEARVSGTVQGVKQRVDVVALVKRHPWPALAAAVLTGIALSATGADRRAASATVRAAKRAPAGAKQGVTAAVRAGTAGVSHLAEAAASRFNDTPDAGAPDDAGRSTGDGRTGVVARLKATASDQAHALEDELRRGAEELPGSTAGGSASTRTT